MEDSHQIQYVFHCYVSIFRDTQKKDEKKLSVKFYFLEILIICKIRESVDPMLANSSIYTF